MLEMIMRRAPIPPLAAVPVLARLRRKKSSFGIVKSSDRVRGHAIEIELLRRTSSYSAAPKTSGIGVHAPSSTNVKQT
jgi:hypothetical protein